MENFLPWTGGWRSIYAEEAAALGYRCRWSAPRTLKFYKNGSFAGSFALPRESVPFTMNRAIKAALFKQKQSAAADNKYQVWTSVPPAEVFSKAVAAIAKESGLSNEVAAAAFDQAHKTWRGYNTTHIEDLLALEQKRLDRNKSHQRSPDYSLERIREISAYLAARRVLDDAL